MSNDQRAAGLLQNGCMDSSIPALEIRRLLGRKQWNAPRPFGPDGWIFDHVSANASVIVSASPAPDDVHGTLGDWWHASISRRDELPSYEDLSALHSAVWPRGFAYQVFAPPGAHVNIHPNALHLWGRPDGRNEMPAFGMHGTI